MTTVQIDQENAARALESWREYCAQRTYTMTPEGHTAEAAITAQLAHATEHGSVDVRDWRAVHVGPMALTQGAFYTESQALQWAESQVSQHGGRYTINGPNNI